MIEGYKVIEEDENNSLVEVNERKEEKVKYLENAFVNINNYIYENNYISSANINSITTTINNQLFKRTIC
jgi:polysaccharide deacetylase 2 family uncharacterized protein YibQ